MSKRSFEAVTPNVFKVEKKYSSYYLKTSPERGSDSIEEEYEYYKILSKYLNTPKIHKIRDADVVVISKVNGISLDQLIDYDIDLLITTLEYFFDDVYKMWQDTNTPYKIGDISYDVLSESDHVLNLFNEEVYKRNIELSSNLIINNINYNTSIKDIIESLKSYQKNTESMVVTHGDEHFKNIFFSQTKKYSIIDPRKSGYQIPSATLNRLIGTSLIFMIDYSTKINQLESGVSINFAPILSSDSYSKLKSTFGLFVRDLNIFTKNNNNLKRLIISNLLRAYLSKVDPKNKERVGRNKFAYLGLINQIYNNNFYEKL